MPTMFDAPRPQGMFSPAASRGMFSPAYAAPLYDEVVARQVADQPGFRDKLNDWWQNTTFFKPAFDEFVGGATVFGDVLSGEQQLYAPDPMTGEVHTDPGLVDRAGALASGMTLGAGAVPRRGLELRSGMSPPEYRGSHKAPGREENAPLHDLAQVYPEDIYSPQAAQYYGHTGQGDPLDEETAAMLRAFRGQPGAEVTVYRAVPKDAPDTINPGDWVTINPNYARQHGEGTLQGDYKIVEQKVRAQELFTDANSMHEFGYDPLPFATNSPAAGIGPAGPPDTPLGPPPRPSIRAYHGSPHDFDKFSMERIGTGEGAQAYGHGMYFAENEGVARDYRRRLSPQGSDDIAPDAQAIADHAEEWQALVEKRRVAQGPDGRGDTSDIAAQMDAVHAQSIQETMARNPHLGGRTYEVDIAANPEDFLDWDKPLSEQPQKVRDILPGGEVLTGATVYGDMAEHLGASELSALLKERGIPGIRYLDQGSRNFDPSILKAEPHEFLDGSKGWVVNSQSGDLTFETREEAQAYIRSAQEKGLTRNFVVFDDAIINILRKYGFPMAPLAGGGAVVGAMQPSESQAAPPMPSGGGW